MEGEIEAGAQSGVPALVQAEVVRLFPGLGAVDLEMLLDTEVARGGIPRVASGQTQQPELLCCQGH